MFQTETVDYKSMETNWRQAQTLLCTCQNGFQTSEHVFSTLYKDLRAQNWPQEKDMDEKLGHTWRTPVDVGIHEGGLSCLNGWTYKAERGSKGKCILGMCQFPQNCPSMSRWKLLICLEKSGQQPSTWTSSRTCMRKKKNIAFLCLSLLIMLLTVVPKLFGLLPPFLLGHIPSTPHSSLTPNPSTQKNNFFAHIFILTLITLFSVFCHCPWDLPTIFPPPL